MEENLDDSGFEKKSEIFTILSILSSIVSFAIFGYMSYSLSDSVFAMDFDALDTLEQPSIWTIRSIQLFAFGSCTALIFSFVKREPSTTLKWIASKLCVLLLFVVMGSNIYYQVLEILRLGDLE